jgi:hypothetical protein
MHMNVKGSEFSQIDVGRRDAGGPAGQARGRRFPLSSETVRLLSIDMIDRRLLEVAHVRGRDDQRDRPVRLDTAI